MSSVSDISTHPLAQASVKSVGRVQILDHSPIWRVQFSSPRNYLKIKIKNDFTRHFGNKIPKHKATISTLQSFVFRKASDVLHSTKHDGFPLAIERFSIECRKTKTRVITLANHKGHR